MMDSNTTGSQPLLPQVSMRWFFIIAGVIGLLCSLFAFQNGLTAWTIVLFQVLIAIGVFFAVLATLFQIAFFLGATKKVIVEPYQRTESPFASDTMPPQVIPPDSVRD
jgi:hypothetical protein